MPGRIRTPVGLFLYRIWYYGFQPRLWKHGLRKAIRAIVPLPVRARIGGFLWRQREGLVRRKVRAHSLREDAAVQVIIPPDDPADPLSFRSVDRPSVSIVVSAHNHWEYTHRCLRAVLEHTDGADYEVLLADDGSDDETTRAGELLSGVTVVSDGTRRGYLENTNEAAQHARGELIVFLNNDTVVQPGWLEALVAIAKDETVGIVGAKLIGEDGVVQEAGSIVWRDGSGTNYGRGLEADAPAVSYVKEVDYVSGACMLVRASLWRDIGGFDRRYSPGYWEDPDLAFEARRRGYRVVYQPQAVVVHYWGVSHGRDVSTGIKRYQVTNQRIFADKWRDELERNQLGPVDEFLARDRSQLTRGLVLVLDHEVPRYDRDAGSRFMHLYVRLLVDLGYRVCLVGDAFRRDEPYTSSFQQYGVEVLYGERCRSEMEQWIEANGRYFDVAYLHRWHVGLKYLELLRTHSSSRVIYGPCDLHFVRERRQSEVIHDSDIATRARRTEEAELELLAGADVVHVVSSFEEDVVRRAVPGVTVRTLPVFFYDDPPPTDTPPFADRRNLMFVGGFLHQPNVDAVVWFATTVYPRVREAIPDALFLVVGSHPPQEVIDLAGDGVIVTGWVTERMLEQLYRQVRVVVCPLRFGAGAKGKLVESLYHQVPSVVTPVAVEGLPGVDDHVLIADNSEEFARRVIELYTTPALWSRLAGTAASYVAPRFSRAAALEAVTADLPAAESSFSVRSHGALVPSSRARN